MHTALDGMSSTYQPNPCTLVICCSSPNTARMASFLPSNVAGNNHGDNFHNMAYNIIYCNPCNYDYMYLYIFINIYIYTQISTYKWENHPSSGAKSPIVTSWESLTGFCLRSCLFVLNKLKAKNRRPRPTNRFNPPNLLGGCPSRLQTQMEFTQFCPFINPSDHQNLSTRHKQYNQCCIFQNSIRIHSILASFAIQ